MKNKLHLNNPQFPDRRRAASLILRTAILLPFAGLLKIRTAYAEDLPHIKPTDPLAVALKYVDDASQAERPEKSGVPGEQQNCLNCFFVQGDEGQWRPCSLFPGKAVNMNGWCQNWMPKT